MDTETAVAGFLTDTTETFSMTFRLCATLTEGSEGLCIRSTSRVLQSNKTSIVKWKNRFADQKATLMLYDFCHEFVPLTFCLPAGKRHLVILPENEDPFARALEVLGGVLSGIDPIICQEQTRSSELISQT